MRKGANPKGRTLQRCDACGQFHAAYRVEDPTLGVLKLCRKCWDARQAKKGTPQ
ncbi:MAG: hypothetical protein HPY85_16235 [Anaerolineae bacterium]|jgi:ribosomal protein S14|nr:hypothetical protein [Anaerolineae bacterium]